jgi:integrative and conjugative element protein (TIGR02256 family)
MRVERTWISLYPAWYVEERSKMAHRWPEFRISARELANGFLAYAGEIQIDLGVERRSFPTVLLYPADTPYGFPLVVPVTEVPAGDDWAVSDLVDIARVRWMPHGYRRHQMSDGVLCLVERDSHASEDRVGGAEILWRAKEVYKAISLGQPFPYPDSEEAALEAHFPIAGDFLLAETFYDPSIAGQGRFYAFPHIDTTRLWPGYVLQTSPERLLFVGINLAQTTAIGIGVEWRNADSPALRRAFPWMSYDAFTYESMSVDDHLRSIVIEGGWYDLQSEPPPMRIGAHLQQLFESAGMSDPGAELEKAGWPLEGVGANLRSPLIAFRFPRRDGTGLEWLILQLALEIDQDTHAALKQEPGMRRELLRGGQILAYRTHPLLRPELELRNTGRVPESLAERSVLVIGCGALGSDVAVTLAKAGVGRLILVDRDILRPGNVIRHTAPIVAVGMKKVDAVRHQIWQHNPFVEVVARWDSATGGLSKLEQLLSDCDIAVSTVADENTEMVVNEAACRAGRTVIYGRALMAGAAARVFRVRPDQDACKQCLALYRRDADAITEDEGMERVAADPVWISLPDAQGEVIGRECGNPILAGSAVDLRFAADLTTRAVIDELGHGSEWNNLAWSREAIPEMHPAFAVPYGMLRQRFAPHPKCTVCGRPLTSEILLAAEVREEITRLTEANARAETGGVLIGYRDADGIVHVLEVTDAGPNAVETASRFERDRDYCQAKVDDAARRLGERGQYIGEWHSHLEGDPQPSARDIESLTGIAEAPNYLTDEPVMLIAGLDPATGKVQNIHASCFPLGRRWYERPLRTITNGTSDRGNALAQSVGQSPSDAGRGPHPSAAVTR